MPTKKTLTSLITLLAATCVFPTTAVPALAASKEKVLYSFCAASGCTDGAYPYYSGVIFDAAGNLYGTTYEGGAGAACHGGCGVVFELKPGAQGKWSEKVLHSFNRKDGAGPGGLIFDRSGNLYGTTYAGGAHNAGAVYELSPEGSGKWKQKLLLCFNGKDGKAPNPGLTLDAAGNLYGTTNLGGSGKAGVVFQLVPGAGGEWTENVLASSYSGEHARGPYGNGLIFDADGNLYGTTQGEVANAGEVFRLKPGADGKWKEQVLYKNFGGTRGVLPPGGLEEKRTKEYEI